MPTLPQLQELTDINRIKSDEAKIDLSNKLSYFVSYPEFLAYFQNSEVVTRHQLIISSNFTYGWMPTILDFDPTHLDDLLSIINSAKKGRIPNESELETLQRCLNKSLVGASKLLHFVNPNSFAIWDNRVYRYLTKTEPHHYRLNKPASYLTYLQFCKELITQHKYEKIHRSMITKIGYEMTMYRTVELIMYLTGEEVN